MLGHLLGYLSGVQRHLYRQPVSYTHLDVYKRQLYTIAKAQLGSGSRYTEIYKLNKKASDKANRNQKVNRYNVEPGIALQLP